MKKGIKLNIPTLLIIAAGCWFTYCSKDSTVRNEPSTPVAVTSENDPKTDKTGKMEATDTYYTPYSPQSTVSDVVNDPAFGNFGRLLFPVDRNVSPEMTLAQVSSSSVYIWYPYVQVKKTVEILNYLHSQADRGEAIFHHIYSPEEMTANRSKADTGIFVFKGNSGSPFAITNAGGGFAYVGAMHDSFPHSLELCKAGYTAFALIYRPDDPYNDLARAITFIQENSETLGIAKANYSLWGGSAGARMAATLGNHANLIQLTGNPEILPAAAVIMQYTGYSTVSQLDPPTYNCVGSNDGIASWRTMQSRLQRLSALGIPTEFHVYEGLGHGFGIGTGTVAEGWVDDAIRFWEANMHQNDTGISPVYPD